MSDGTDLPWMKFYPSDFMGAQKVRSMTGQQRGIYISLMCECWEAGSIPDDPDQLWTVCGVTPDEMRDAWPKVRQCFDEHPEKNGRLIQPRVEAEREAALNRRNAAQKAAQARQETADRDASGRYSGNTSDEPADGGAKAPADAGADAPAMRASGASDTQKHRGSDQQVGKTKRQEQEWGTPDDWPSPSALPKDGGRIQYPDEFEQMWGDRVRRDGKNPKKRGYRMYRKARQGEMSRDEAELALTMRRREANRKNENGERYVEQFATFFGQDDLWREYVEDPDPADVANVDQATRDLYRKRAEMADTDYEEVDLPF